ncbi:NUDIX domain-containing protein [Roseomonas sp. OT10]|uniref:NUDIX domain-containing protein n=1 Tax=Roseomonas cutis TaxID=2897332 RepID=UPI001E4675EB|nr:NUDIX domain-containing protein [Roseomonas sp. OT10]UFN47725.1 NUDIX domain-containing protein [Roseomonas sp. OT10]
MSGRFEKVRHEGDERDRLTCLDCGHIAYENPKVVVGAVVEAPGGLLLCRRAIEPRAGFWTLPAGYMEMGETAAEGAAREAWEEARARIAIDGVLAVYSIARIGQVQILFRARLQPGPGPGYAPGPESLEVRVFPWEALPWESLAFPSVRWALRAWQGSRGGPLPATVLNPAEDPRGMRSITEEHPT